MSEDSTIAEAQSRRALGVDDDGLRHGLEEVVPDQRVVAQIFDVREPSLAAKPISGGQIAQSPTDLEGIGVLDRRFGAEGLVLFVILLDPRLLAVDGGRSHRASPGTGRTSRI